MLKFFVSFLINLDNGFLMIGWFCGCQIECILKEGRRDGCDNAGNLRLCRNLAKATTATARAGNCSSGAAGHGAGSGSEEKRKVAKQLYFTTLIYDSDDIEGAETLTIKSWKPQTDETRTPMSRDRVRMHILR